MRREFPVGPHDDGRLLRRDPVHHRRDPQARVPHRQVSGYMAGGGQPWDSLLVGLSPGAFTGF